MTENAASRPAMKPADAWRITVTRKAVDQFRAAHPNTDRVEEQLRELVADMIATGKAYRTSRCWGLFLQGFDVTISRDLKALIAYRTSHKHRTWAQVKAGVPSPTQAEASQRQRRNQGKRRLAELALFVLAEGGQVVRSDDDETMDVTGPDGTMRVHFRDLTGPAWYRADFYADLADATGLANVEELAPVVDDGTSDTSWLAIE